MAQNGARDCILAPGLTSLSFQGLVDHISHVETQLRAAGIAPGACVASALPNGPYAASAFISFASSCLYAPLNRDDDDHAFGLALAHLMPAAIVLKSGDAAPARAAAQRVGIKVIELETPKGHEAGRFELTIPRIASSDNCGPGQQPGLLMQTSGTTSQPKFVSHTHRSLLHAARFLIQAHSLSPADRCLNISALHHSLGLVGSVMIAILSGGSVVCTPGFEPEEFFRWIRDFSPTWYSAVPAIHLAIGTLASKHQDTLRCHPLRFSRSAGASLPQEARRKIEDEMHAPIVQTFGLSECAPITVDPLPPSFRKPGSVGVMAGPELEIRDDSGIRLGPNCSGHIVVRGPNVMSGYYKDAVANAAAFTNGWFRTGDCGYLDGDGFLFLTGRIREFINRGGEKIAPGEIDALFGSHPDVAQAVTFAVHDDRLGEEVATAVIPRHAGAVTVEQLRRFAATRLAFHKIPRRIFLVTEIPAGRTEKPDRSALRARFDSVTSQSDERVVLHVEPRTDLEKKIASVWTDAIGVAAPGIHDSFFDSGGDSLAAVRFLTGLSEVLGTEKLRLGSLIEAPTIAELALLLSKPVTASHPAILPLQPSGSGTPLFWIDGFAAMPVVQTLDRPLFLVSLPDPPQPDASRIIDQHVEGCIRSLRQFHPKGPYYLAGWCAAGVIALEVARRLQAEGDEVALILFDARGVLRHDSNFLKSRWISAVRGAQKLLYHFKKMMELEASDVIGYTAERIKTQWGRVRRSVLDTRRKLVVASGGDMPAILRNSQVLFSIALMHYRAQAYAGRMIHIWATDRPKGLFRDLKYEWGEVGGRQMELYEVAGNHITMFQGANGRALGRTLNHCLSKMEQGGRPSRAKANANHLGRLGDALTSV